MSLDLSAPGFCRSLRGRLAAGSTLRLLLASRRLSLELSKEYVDESVSEEPVDAADQPAEEVSDVSFILFILKQRMDTDERLPQIL